MTAPREDASALVGEVRALQSWPFLDQRQVQRLMRCAVSLCALVEQGERDRRRLDWLEHSAASLWCNYASGDDAFSVEVDTSFMDGGDKYARRGHTPRAAIDAAMQPNDSAARTGQEG